LKLKNTGSKLELVKIEDKIPQGLRVIKGNFSVLTKLSPEESISLEYTVTGSRGMYHFDSVEISASDTLQVISTLTKIKTDDHLFIQPNPIHLGHLKIQPQNTRVYAGHIPARTGGSGVEFFGVREYQPGNPLRWINWRASARFQQKFFINEFEQERVADVGIIVDSRQSSQIVSNQEESLFDHSVQAASAIAETFLKEGNRVGLLMFGMLLDWTFPNYGKLQRERILRRLSAAKPGESQVFEDLNQLPTRLLSPKSQIVYISPIQRTDLQVLITLRARGYAVMVISPNPILFEMKQIDQKSETIEIASHLAGLERTLLTRKLQQTGIQVLDWDTDIPLNQAISAEFTRQTVPQIEFQF
jgi:uncharacterized protein (DUF58 family)